MFRKFGWCGQLKTLGLNTCSEVAMKEYEYSEAVGMINLWYFRNTSPSSI